MSNKLAKFVALFLLFIWMFKWIFQSKKRISDDLHYISAILEYDYE